MGQAERTTKLELDLSHREQGGANSQKRRYLEATRRILDEARADLTWRSSSPIPPS